MGLRPALSWWCNPPHTYRRSPLALTVRCGAAGDWRQTARLTKHTSKPTHAPLFQPSWFQSYFLPSRKRNEESRKWLLKCQSAQWGKSDVGYTYGAVGRGHEVKWELGDAVPLFLPCHSSFLWELSWKWRDKIWCFWLACGVQGCVWPPLLNSSHACSQGLVFLDLPLKRKMTFTCDEELQSSDQMSPLTKLSQYAVSLSGKLFSLI